MNTVITTAYDPGLKIGEFIKLTSIERGKPGIWYRVTGPNDMRAAGRMELAVFQVSSFVRRSYRILMRLIDRTTR